MVRLAIQFDDRNPAKGSQMEGCLSIETDAGMLTRRTLTRPEEPEKSETTIDVIGEWITSCLSGIVHAIVEANDSGAEEHTRSFWPGSEMLVFHRISETELHVRFCDCQLPHGVELTETARTGDTVRYDEFVDEMQGAYSEVVQHAAEHGIDVENDTSIQQLREAISKL